MIILFSKNKQIRKKNSGVREIVSNLLWAATAHYVILPMKWCDSEASQGCFDLYRNTHRDGMAELWGRRRNHCVTMTLTDTLDVPCTPIPAAKGLP